MATIEPLVFGWNKITAALIIAIGGVAMSCHDDEPESIKPLGSFSPRFMFYDFYIERLPQQPITVEYDGSRNPVRISGGFIDFVAEGYRSGVYAEIYDSIGYSGNEIHLTRKENHPIYEFPSPFTRKIILDDNDRISMIIRPTYQGGELTLVDTTFFSYQGTGEIEKTTEKRWRIGANANTYRSTETKVYTYFNGNVTLIEGTRIGRQGVITKTLESFEGYDNAKNPAYKLAIIDEIFYRSLSKNNFTKYFYKLTTEDGDVIDASTKEWTLSYDNNGLPTFL